MVPEAPLRKSDGGLVPEGEGWFVLDARQALCDVPFRKEWLPTAATQSDQLAPRSGRSRGINHLGSVMVAILKWITRFRQARDAAALKRAEAEAIETPQEREISSGDIEAMQLDEEVARLAGDTRSESKRRGE